MNAGLGQRCGACGKPLVQPPHQVDTRDGQVVYVGPECARHIANAGTRGWKPPLGGPKLYPVRESVADTLITSKLLAMSS